jgi:AraC-like DNA-binding protein
MRAQELLAAGTPVTTVALDLGYETVSAFIAMFRRAYGVTPTRYVEEGPTRPGRTLYGTSGSPNGLLGLST